MPRQRMLVVGVRRNFALELGIPGALNRVRVGSCTGLERFRVVNLPVLVAEPL